jgi:hypothetical protein
MQITLGVNGKFFRFKIVNRRKSFLTISLIYGSIKEAVRRNGLATALLRFK